MIFRIRNPLFSRIVSESSPARIISKYCRCMSSELPPRSEDHNRKIVFNQCQNERSSSGKKYHYLAYGVVPLVGYYYFHKKKYINFNIIPEVEAATRQSSRIQYNFIADTVEKSAGAVVCIDIKDTARLDFFAWGPQSKTNGSGFVIEEDGLILTNAHVVMGHPQSSIQVKLSDGTVYPGQVVDIDVKTDLAAIRIKPKNKLPCLKLGESKDLRPGEFVIAMGSPLALSNTVTSGIVSSTCRKSSELNLYDKDMYYIQTDASITFGNSGGPLINLDGEVVGINSMKVAQAGISFAIPVEYAKDFVTRSKNRQIRPKGSGEMKRYLGLTMISLTPEIINELQMRNHFVPPGLTEGALVWKVVVGSPAHKGGLMPGDIVTDINDVRVKSSNAVYEALDSHSVLNIRIFRGHGYYDVVVYPEDVV